MERKPTVNELVISVCDRQPDRVAPIGGLSRLRGVAGDLRFGALARQAIVAESAPSSSVGPSRTIEHVARPSRVTARPTGCSWQGWRGRNASAALFVTGVFPTEPRAPDRLARPPGPARPRGTALSVPSSAESASSPRWPAVYSRSRIARLVGFSSEKYARYFCVIDPASALRRAFRFLASSRLSRLEVRPHPPVAHAGSVALRREPRAPVLLGQPLLETGFAPRQPRAGAAAPPVSGLIG